MKFTPEPHVPYQPLLDYLVLTGAVEPNPTRVDIGLATGVSRRFVHRAIRNGWITIWAADEAATHLETHPALIWGPDWYHVDELVAS